MLYNAQKMRTAKKDEIKEILTWICCFMYAVHVWERKKYTLTPQALRRPTN